jgi:hypothetical protein
MCVIICKPRGTALPNEQTLIDCWTSNPHGAGYAICRAGNTITEVHKGFMDLFDLLVSLEAEDIQLDDLVILHFRIATAGKIDGPTCHPFPIADSVKALRALEYTSARVVAHNGVIHNDPPALLSDTQKFIMQVLSRLNDFRYLDATVGSQIDGSRLAVLDNGILRLAGEGWKVHTDGCIYSNMYWAPEAPCKPRKRSKRATYRGQYWLDPDAAELDRMEREWRQLTAKYYSDTFSEEMVDEWLYSRR